jgi:ribose transport system substrate-binding protein
MKRWVDSKKWVAVVSIAALAALVAACGSSSSGSSGYKMTLIAGVKGDEFYETMDCGAQAAARADNVNLDFQGPDQFDPSLQTPIVDAVAAQKPDAVLIAPTDSKAMYAPIKQLAATGSKVVLVDTTLDNPSVAVSQISSDNFEGGKVAAQTLGKLIGGKGKVMIVNVKPGVSTTDARARGFEQEVKTQPGVQYLGQQYDNDDPAQAASIVSATLAKNPDLKGIFAANVFSGEGAATALTQAGKLGKVKIVGFDASPKQVQDLKQGLVQALVAQEPATIGKDGVQQALDALKGKPTTKKIGTGFKVITRDNLARSQSSLYKATC